MKESQYLKKCPKCHGRKKHEGYGYMMITCKTCDGLGMIKKEYEETIKPNTDNMVAEVNSFDSMTPPKRRGRPPRIKEVE